jgi:N-acetylglucosamine-6-phosphate deacetylase
MSHELEFSVMAESSANIQPLLDQFEAEHRIRIVVALAWKAKGPGRVNLVTDAIAALGMPPGRYRLGDFEVMTDGTSARLADGRLAGSVLALDQAVRNLIAFTGCSLAEAIGTVTATPAALLGLLAERGRIAPGLLADLALWSPDLRVTATIVQGQAVYAMPGDQATPRK